ncbi:hypothetical protein GOP47_0027887 [Adiantum capillus-veneris]|nr:hypothetical protein GOP47_0027887 [Adiantum capillus-veneris]
MLQGGVSLSRDAIYRFLQVCYKDKDLAHGRQLHSLMIMVDLDRFAGLGDHLIRLFAACGGTLLESSLVFCALSHPKSYTWQAIIFAHAVMGQHEHALKLYINMQGEGVMPCQFVLTSVLKGCASLASLHHGRTIHDHIFMLGLESNLVLGSSLLDMYGKCGYPLEARSVFDALPCKNAVAWSSMMAAYVQHGWGVLALELFEAMEEEAGIQPDEVSFLFALKACTCIGNIWLGRLIHEKIMQGGFLLNGAIGNAMLDMYAKCGSLEEACNTFKRLPARTLVSYGTIIAGYAQHAYWIPAIEVFRNFLQEGKRPNEVILLSLVKACSTREAIDQGQLVHNQVIENELEENLVLGSALIHMYVKCGNIRDAYNIFKGLPGRDVVSWDVIMSGCLSQELGITALDVFKEMQGEGIKQDQVILLSGVKACGRLKAVEDGRSIHHLLVEDGFESDIIVRNAVLDMYLRCGKLRDALEVHSNSTSRDVVTWNTAIAGSMLDFQDLSPTEIFGSMYRDCITPDLVTFTLLLKKYGSLGALEHGKQVFQQMVKSGCKMDLVTGTALVYMYASCGHLDDAHKVFLAMQHQDVVSWNALIVGYIQQGNYSLAMQCLRDLEKQGIQPNASTCTSILAICSHIGALEAGYQFLAFMKAQGMIPQIEHVNSMIDLLGRSGCLDEAKKLAAALPGVTDNVSWRSLLNSCKMYGNYNLANKCADQLAMVNADFDNDCELCRMDTGML